jgi:hypothetical protein
MLGCEHPHGCGRRGFNRFGLFGVTFLISWICISVPFCAPTCMFYPKGNLHTKKNRGHERPLRVDSTYLMGREGFISPYKLLINKEIKITLGKYTQKYTHRELTAV